MKCMIEPSHSYHAMIHRLFGHATLSYTTLCHVVAHHARLCRMFVIWFDVGCIPTRLVSEWVSELVRRTNEQAKKRANKRLIA